MYATLLSVSASPFRELHNNEASKFICLNCTLAPERESAKSLPVIFHVYNNNIEIIKFKALNFIPEVRKRSIDS